MHGCAALLPLDEFRVLLPRRRRRLRLPEAEAGPADAAARTTISTAAVSWSATAGATSRPAGVQAAATAVLVDYGYDEPMPDGAGRARAIARRSRRLDSSTHGEQRMNPSTSCRVKIFADGADSAACSELYRQPYIKGFTTNPTLMRKAGITDYRAFASEVLAAIPDRPISFEVFSDEFAEMERQALEIADAGASNVYVKIPVTNTQARAGVRSDPPAVARAASS